MNPLATLMLTVFSIFSFGCNKDSNSRSLPATGEAAEVDSMYEIDPMQKSIDESAVAIGLKKYEDSKVYPEDFVQSELLDKTLHFYDRGHGNQIEYLSADGNAYLWYPGNSIIVKGKWTVIENQLIAFSFEEGTYNPVTNKMMDSWDYRELEFFVETINDKRDGDVFQLSEGLPRILKKNEPIDFQTFEP